MKRCNIHNSLIFTSTTHTHELHKKSERMKELPVAVPIVQRRTKISSLFLIQLPAPAVKLYNPIH